jgi:uncharacterized protein (TIGR03437 family)
MNFGFTPYSSLSRYSGTAREIVRLPEQVIAWDVDGAGQVITAMLLPFNAAPEVPFRVVRIDVLTGHVRDIGLLRTGPRPSFNAPYVSYSLATSANGQISVGSEAVDGVVQLAVIEASSDGFLKRQLTDFVGGVIQFAFSDDGAVVWALTGEAQIMKIDVASGAATEYVGPSFLPQFIPNAALGSRYTLVGMGLAHGRGAANGFPWPESLGGVRFTINGTPLRLEAIEPGRVSGQIPWSTRPGPIVFDPGFTSVFERAVEPSPRATLLEYASAFLPQVVGVNTFILAAHQDWRGLVTPSDPAKGGEVLHLYATGLGPPIPTPPDGEPTPASDQFQLRSPLRCETTAVWGPPIQMLWAGLAPGLIGIYQVSIRLPEQLPGSDGKAEIVCRLGTITWMRGTLAMDPSALMPEILVRTHKPHVPESLWRMESGRRSADR